VTAPQFFLAELFCWMAELQPAAAIEYLEEKVESFEGAVEQEGMSSLTW
jgi:hypothetical protein